MRSAVVLAFAGSLVLSGCGSNGQSEGSVSRATPPTTAANEEAASADTGTVALVSQADALCSAFDEVVAANGPLGIDGFNADEPDPAELPLVAEHFAPVLDAADELRDQLASLTGGTDTEQALLGELVVSLEAENANARAQADAARLADAGAFTATLQLVEQLVTARIDAALALGASHCATP